jgi:GTPase
LKAFLELQYVSFVENPKSHIIPLNQEDNEGKIEYKLKLVNPTPDRLNHLTTQMKYRLQEGNGEAIYEIGVEDNGNPLGLSLFDMLESISKIFFGFNLWIT